MKRTRKLRLFVVAAAAVAVFALATVASAAGTAVPGQATRSDADDNGFPEAGVEVVGVYSSLYAYDANGGWYLDLGHGRPGQGTVGSVDELDQATLTVCEYVNQYRGTFGNDPYLDSGWIKNNIRCYGYDGTGTYNYLIVHESDPRYTGSPDWAVWGTWEYHLLTESGSGNQVAKDQIQQP